MTEANKKAQRKQDEIFREMSADKKLELGSKLWLLAKELTKGRRIRTLVRFRSQKMR
ncbi:MAG: hypothetical protein HYX22_03330 [Candidatus Yanofskybacteria bacterium]|nr:hypothetical protein [Candidatus Yanofskybacteria bacterium]